MAIEQPADTQDVILLDESETKAQPSSLPQLEDSSEHDELPGLPKE
jgi:hypothetical protein